MRLISHVFNSGSEMHGAQGRPCLQFKFYSNSAKTTTAIYTSVWLYTSALLFTVYAKHIISEVLDDADEGAMLNGKRLNNIRYADHTIIFA